MTKVLFISFVQPFPADNGKKAVLQGLVSYFLTRPHIHVDYIILDGVGPDHLPDANLTFHPLSRRTREPQILSGLARSIRRQLPLQQTLLDSGSLRRAIARRIAAIEPDIVIYDTIRVSQFIDDPHALLPNARHILYLDDLFSVRYAATLRAMDRYPSVRVQPLGNFATHLPRLCRPLVRSPRVCRYLLEREMRLVKEVETAEVARFDLSLLVNPAEVAVLQDRSGRNGIATLPITLPARLAVAPVRHHQDRPEFVFMGALNVAHNQCSLEYFIANVFAECVERMPGFRLRVIGQDASEDLRRLFARYPQHIEWIAWVADLGEIFARCSAMIVPLLFGSGIKVKTLEALSYALPVISTRFGAEGIASNPAEVSGIIVEDDVRRFPQHMCSVLDPQTNRRLSGEVQQYYAASYGPEANRRRYAALFGV